MEIGGLPVHPLVVHAAVVLTPAAAVLAAVFALRTRWRWLTRWPTVLTTVAALGALLVAKVSGESLLRSRTYLLQSPALAEQIHSHQARANELVAIVAVFTVLVLVAAWTLGGPSALVTGWGARESRVVVLDRVLSVALVVGAVVVLVWVVRTGDAGARAVWTP
jgi:hypothetical protein